MDSEQINYLWIENRSNMKKTYPNRKIVLILTLRQKICVYPSKKTTEMRALVKKKTFFIRTEFSLILIIIMKKYFENN